MSTITEPPYNDLWTVEGEADKLEDWKKGDCDFFNSVDSMYYYHQEQIKDFLHAVETHTKPLVDAATAARPWSCSRPSTAAPRPTPSSNSPSAEMGKKECCCL